MGDYDPYYSLPRFRLSCDDRRGESLLLLGTVVRAAGSTHERGGVSKDRLLAWLLVLRLVVLRTVCSSIRHLRLSRWTSAKDHSLVGQNNLWQRRFFPKWTISRVTGQLVSAQIHISGNGVYQELGRIRCWHAVNSPGSMTHIREDSRTYSNVQSTALSLRELPPLQSGYRLLMSAINVAFGTDGIKSMMKDSCSGMHTSLLATTL